MRNVLFLAMAVFVLTIPIFLWSAEDGAVLYESNCAMCHGAKGEGNPDSDIPKVVGTSMTIENLTAYITKGEKDKTMHAGPIDGVSEAQAKAIATYVKSLKD
jgi:mono/diheme cytochrome c family protein